MTRSREFVDAELAERMLESADEVVTPSGDLRRSILAGIGKQPFSGFVPRVSKMLDLPSDRIESLLAHVKDSTAADWVDGSTAGVRLFHFDGGPRVEGAHCGLVEVQGGTHYPNHRHLGDEWAFVIQGSSREADGRILAPGDLVRYAAGSSHSFDALGTEPFVFVVVLREGMEFIEVAGSESGSR